MNGRGLFFKRARVGPECFGHNAWMPRLGLVTRSHHGRVGQLQIAFRIGAPIRKGTSLNARLGIHARPRVLNNYFRGGGLGHHSTIESGIEEVCKSLGALVMAVCKVLRYKRKRVSGSSKPLPKVLRMSL